MSDEKENLQEAANSANEAADKPATAAETPAPETAKPSTSASKQAPKPPRSKKEKILIGALVAAIVGFGWAAIHMVGVLNQAKDPLAQSATGSRKAYSEAELEKEEANLQPKNPVLIPADSTVLHEVKPAPKAPAAKSAPVAKAGKAK
jgi:hypothetical protein